MSHSKMKSLCIYCGSFIGGSSVYVEAARLMPQKVEHGGLTCLHIVKDIHEHNAIMAALSDEFIAMPGRISTLEELFKMFS